MGLSKGTPTCPSRSCKGEHTRSGATPDGSGAQQSLHSARRDHLRESTRAQGPYLTSVYTWGGLCRWNSVAWRRDHIILPCGMRSCFLNVNFVVVVRAQGGIRCSARASVAGISECERRGEGAQKRRSERGRHLARGAPGEGRIHLGGALQIELRCTTARSHHAALRDHERESTRAQGPHLTRGVYTWEGLCRLNFVASLRDHTTLPYEIIQQRALVLRVHEREAKYAPGRGVST